MTHHGRKVIGEFDTPGVLKIIETKWGETNLPNILILNSKAGRKNEKTGVTKVYIG